MILDCGHAPIRATEHVPGIARDATSGQTLCFDCAEKGEEEAFRTVDRYVVYVGKDRKVTTWTGYVLGKVLHSWQAGSINGYPIIHYRIRANDGSRWHGKHGGFFSGEGSALQVKRTK